MSPSLPTPTLAPGTHRLRVLKPGHVGVVIHGGVRAGEASGAGGGGSPEAGARTAGRAREMPLSPAALRTAAPSEGARRRERAAKPSCSELRAQITAPPSPPPKPCRCHPKRRRGIGRRLLKQ